MTASSSATPLTVSPADVRRCLDDTGPQMRYQPIVHLETGVVIGAEAFSRFPSTAPVLDWFRCAEDAGLGSELELRAVDNILAVRTRWPRSWEMVCVNVSPERLRDEQMRLTLSSVPESRLVVELTDQTALPDDWQLRDQLERLRNDGVLIAVSGLRPGDVQYERILRIQPEIVKLDVAILDRIDTDPARKGAVEALVSACRRTGVFVVAVGIENEEQLRFVRSMGIDAAQGHLFGVPSDIDAPSLTERHLAASSLDPTA
ncbi:MAG: EAL domain-containing protein [Ilumatobacteraceae bacterium]